MYERIMGIQVIDDQEYKKYRDGMFPILQSFGGSFGYDFKIEKTLVSKTKEQINRVFTIDFPNKETMHQFFSDAEYLAVKKKHFNHSVSSVTTICKHDSKTTTANGN